MMALSLMKIHMMYNDNDKHVISSSLDLQSPPSLGSTRRCRRSCHCNCLSRFKGGYDDDDDDGDDDEHDDDGGDVDDDDAEEVIGDIAFLASILKLKIDQSDRE